MSSMLENLVNPVQRDQLEERMARIKEDPSLKPILEEIEKGGPAAMMRFNLLAIYLVTSFFVQSLPYDITFSFPFHFYLCYPICTPLPSFQVLE